MIFFSKKTVNKHVLRENNTLYKITSTRTGLKNHVVACSMSHKTSMLSTDNSGLVKSIQYYNNNIGACNI